MPELFHHMIIGCLLASLLDSIEFLTPQSLKRFAAQAA
jgi:hypothetical protein